MKQKHASKLVKRGGLDDAYTFVVLDADTRLVPAFHVRRRTRADTQSIHHGFASVRCRASADHN